MQKCQRCSSHRILSVQGKTSDRCHTTLQVIPDPREEPQSTAVENDGYVPRGFGIGGGDYIEVEICLNCGQSQGTFPVELSDCEKVVECAECEFLFRPQMSGEPSACPRCEERS